MGTGGDFIIAYGSHTGQAEAIATQIKEKAELLGCSPRLFVLNDNEKEFDLTKESLAVIVVSSTGDGDPPENCARFLRRIHRKTLEQNHLIKLEYALLGLGDSNYSTYQGIPRKVDKQLEFLGAKRIVPSAEADDQVGLELTVEPWIERLFKILASRFSVDENKLASIFSTEISLNPVKSKEEKTKIAEDMNNTKPEVVDLFPMLKLDDYSYPDHSIKSGDEKLRSDPNLRVPIAPQNFLVSAVSHKIHDPSVSKDTWQNGCKMVGVVSAPYTVSVVGTALVTFDDVKKPKREIVIDLGEHSNVLPYEPGDAFYFIAPNSAEEVSFILDRLGLLDVADNELTVSVDKTTKKINPTVPGHIPPTSSLRHLFTYCLDIRRAPGRPLLRIFADCAANDAEKRRLLELCSAQGMNDFTIFIRQAGLSVADVLAAFPSVKPSVDRLIELLPRLMPRPYSVSSARGRRIRFVYSVMDFSAEEGRRYARNGVATEWLIKLRVGDNIQVMAKEPARFRFPPPPLPSSDALKMPLLMIGPGTGVAVFLSFCQHLLKEKNKDPENFPHVPRYLYFGCRDLNKDFIYRDELESYVREGILTKLIVCESQGESGRPKYVQHALKENMEEVKQFMELDSEVPSRIFICGDAKGMSKDVFQCFKEIVETQYEKPSAEAMSFIADLKKADRYVEDVWS